MVDPNKPPKSDEGHGADPHPDDPKKIDQPGHEEIPPKADDGHGDDWESRYKKLQSTYTPQQELLVATKQNAAAYGYCDPTTGKVSDKDLEDFNRDLGYILSKQKPEPTDPPKGEDGDEDIFKPPPEPKAEEEKIDPRLLVAARLAVAGNKKSEYLEYKELLKDAGLSAPDAETKRSLDRVIDQMMDQAPKMLQKGNWYRQAVKWAELSDDDSGFLKSLKDKAIKEERDRVEKADSFGGDLDGGKPPTGKSKKIEDELAERFGGK